MPAHKRNQREKGVALLFSLGILGLMTVLALTFASVSMTSQQTAKNATNKASARFLASSIPAHIASLLYQDAYFTVANTPERAHMPLYSKTQSGTKSYDWIWKLAIRDASLKSAIYEMDAPNYATPEQNPTWQYISRKEDGEDKIVARIAYVAVPSEALIDLNSTLLMEDGTLPTAYTRRGISICGELEPAVLFNQIPKESEEGDTFNYFGNNLEKAKTGASQDRFTSYDDIQRYITTGLAADVLKQFNRHFIRAFAPNSVRYPEVFTLPGTTDIYHRIDLVALSKKISVLKDNAKRKLALEAIVNDGKSMQIPNPKESPFSEANRPYRISNGESGEGPFAYPQIPWFKEFNTSDLSGFANSDTKRNQIVANLLDFFTPLSSDDGTKIGPTSDVDPNSWSVDGSNTPTYTGLKKSPYICGTGALLAITPIYTAEKESYDGAGNILYKYKVDLNASIDFFTELINMYANLGETTSQEILAGGTLSISGTLAGTALTVDIDIDIAIPNSANANKMETSDGTVTRQYFIQKIADTSLTGKGGPYYVRNAEDKTLFTSTSSTLPSGHEAPLKIDSITLKPLIRLKWNDVPVDFANLSATEGVAFTTETKVAEKKTYYIGAARRASDPRHNLPSTAWNGDWKCAKELTDTLFIPAELLNGAVAGTTSTDADRIYADRIYADTYPTTADPSTGFMATKIDIPEANRANVYLRGTPIGDRTSFQAWELAFIHRAAPWENLNFTTYAANEEDGSIANKGGTSYTAGDLALLDQLKLTWYTDSAEETSSEKKEKTDSPKLFSYGKLNLNELTDKNYYAFNALLQNALPDKNIPQAGTTYDEVTLSNLVSYFQQKANSSTPFKSRVQLFHKPTTGVDLWEGVSDSDKAKIFPSLIFLLDAEPTVLPRRAYVLGIAQTIKEGVKGDYSKYWGTDYQYPSGFQTPEGNNVTNPQVSGDTTTGAGPTAAKFNQYDLGADQITGEQKVFSVLEREYTLQPYSNSTSNYPKWTIKEVKYADY